MAEFIKGIASVIVVARKPHERPSAS
ncbi:rCG52825 [Rattus norvegicus]|uniref:RCG52825 n=1 Tax=Rattus norvegicus TaxID=10116 RepID=A6IQU4_RAT|nr:rCG52825 [Rattus norvegicus]